MPTKQEIETLAHQLWEEDGRPDGKAEEHWARAKSLLETGNDDPQSPVMTSDENVADAKSASKPRKTAARKTATTSKPASTPKTRTRKTG